MHTVVVLEMIEEIRTFLTRIYFTTFMTCVFAIIFDKIVAF